MKTFSSQLGSSVLSLNLKAGIWAGVASVSFASAGLTLYNCWDEVSSNVLEAYNKASESFKSYIYDPTSKFLTQLYDSTSQVFTDGLTNLFSEIRKGSEPVLSKSSELASWLWDKLEFKKLVDGFKNGLVPVLKQSFKHFEDLLKVLPSISKYIKDMEIHQPIHSIYKGLRMIKEFFSALKDAEGDSEKLSKLGQASKEVLKQEKGFDVVKNLGGAFFQYPEVLQHIEMEDITNSLLKGLADADKLTQGANSLEKTPINRSQFQGEALKNELLERLFPCQGGFWSILSCIVTGPLIDFLTTVFPRVDSVK